MHPMASLGDAELLRPEPARREGDSSGGALFIGLIFTGLAIFVASTKDMHQVANVDSACPVAAITYCDRQ